MPTRFLLPVAVTAAVAFPFTALQIRGQSDRPDDLRREASSTRSWLSAGNGATDDHDAGKDFRLRRENVRALKTRWVFSADGEVQGTPTVDNDQVYFSDAAGSVWRVNASTGADVWKISLPSITGISGSFSRVSPALSPDLLVVGDQATASVIALSRHTGNLAWRVELSRAKGSIITSSPVVVGDRVYVGVSSHQETMASTTKNFVPTFRGSIAALDLHDGHVLWQTYTVPPGYTGGAVFASTPAVDLKRSTVYMGIGNNYSVPLSVRTCQLHAHGYAETDKCLSPDDHIDSIVALDMNSGAIRWSHRFAALDTWTVSCIPASQPPATPCPVPTGKDADFASGPNLFTVQRGGKSMEIVGAGRKSGAYYALDRDTGAVVWGSQVSPGGSRGGIEWSTATDGQRIYVPCANSRYVDATLLPSGNKTRGGFWSALDAATGQILWQTPTFTPAPTPSSPRAIKPPKGALSEAEGSVTTVSGIVFGEDAAGTFVAIDGATGKILWTFASGGAGVSGPAVAGGSLYWPSGYEDIGPTNDKVYAFSTDRGDHGQDSQP